MQRIVADFILVGKLLERMQFCQQKDRDDKNESLLRRKEQALIKLASRTARGRGWGMEERNERRRKYPMVIARQQRHLFVSLVTLQIRNRRH